MSWHSLYARSYCHCITSQERQAQIAAEAAAAEKAKEDARIAAEQQKQKEEEVLLYHSAYHQSIYMRWSSRCEMRFVARTYEL
jgi:hypothetical protein